MKKITFSLLKLCQIIVLGFYLTPKTTNAQQLENATTYTHESLVTLAPLLTVDQNLYKNSILYDRVLGLANLRALTTIIDTDSEHFKRTWQELHSARLQTTDKHISLNKLNQISKHYLNQNIIPVGIINMDYTQFKEQVLEDFEADRTSISQLANRNRSTVPSPYENKHIFLASPITRGTIETAANVPVTFKTDLFVLDQADLSIDQLQVRYNNITKTIIQNGNLGNNTFSFNFSSSGNKNLQFIAKYTNGKQLISNAAINVEILHVLHKNSVSSITANEPFQGYDEPSDCGGSCLGQGEYQISLGKGHSKLAKPLIILDGFDPGDDRKIDNLVFTINRGGQEPNMDKFKNAGYDVVILNFPNYKIGTKTERIYNPTTERYTNITTDVYRDGGADYIERNANVLKALISKLNTELITNGSAEKLKIIGPSMGGLISRVALTQMEQANQNHNTDLWVSFDSPHLGANIPIGLQYFFTFMELEQIELLKTPAAKQMLILQNEAPLSLQEIQSRYGNVPLLYNALVEDYSKYPGDYSFRNRFKSLLNSLGFPNNTRNLALINGNLNGKRQGTPKSIELDVDAKIVQSFLGSLGRYQIKTFSTHDGGRHKIFERYKRVLFFKNRKSVYLNDNSGRGSLDNAPGGTYDMIDEFEGALGITLPLTNANAGRAVDNLTKEPYESGSAATRIMIPFLLTALNSSIYLDLHQGSPAFIPTKSSLAFKGANKVWHEYIGDRDLVCTNEIPFDSYYAPKENEPHITLNSKNMEWLIKELNGIPQSPTTQKILNESSIIGDFAVCNNKTNIYKLDIPDTCSGLTVSWSTSSNIQIVSSSNNKIRVTAINGTNDPSGFIKAYVQEKDMFINKFVWVGIPSPNFLSIQKLGSYNFYTNQWSKLKVIHPIPAISQYINDPNYGLSYQWLVPNSMVRNFNDSSIIDVKPLSTGSLNIGVKMQNECGCTNFKYQLFNVTWQSSGSGSGGGTGGGPVLTIDPGY